MDDPRSVLGHYWPRSGRAILNSEREPNAGSATTIALPTTPSEGGRAKPHRERDLVVRGQEAFPPRSALAAARHLGEQTQAVVLPLLDRVEISRVVVDERLDEGSAVADVARLVADARPVVYRGQDG